MFIDKKNDKKGESKSKSKKSNKDLEEVIKEGEKLSSNKSIPDQNHQKKTVSWIDEIKPKKTGGFEHIFQQTLLDENLKQLITEKVSNKNTQYITRIKSEDDAFKGENQEKDLKKLMNKWKTDLNKFDLKETLSIIYAKETKLIKRDLDRNIQTIEENAQILGTSDGFKFVGKQLGFDSDKIIKRSDKLFSPNSESKSKSMSYYQLRDLRNHEIEEKK